VSLPVPRPFLRAIRGGALDSIPPPARAAVLSAALLVVSAGPLTAQYRLEAPSGLTLEFSSTEVRAILDTTRALERNLQEDPRVLYFTLIGPSVEADSADAAYPWNAVEVRTDSVATILTPGNLREADRAYYNYAVTRMQLVRELDPDVPCDELVEREIAAVSAFVDGWLSSRLLFGGLPFAPLDEVVFAREQGQLAGMLAAKGDRQLGACVAEWIASHPGAVEEYRSWRDARFLGLTEDPLAKDPPAEDPPAADPPAAATGR
jgi:hypothetical protein